MGIIAWIVLGAIAGSIARRLAGINDLPFGFTTGLGILGAVVGGALANRILGHDSVNGFWDASTWATADSTERSNAPPPRWSSTPTPRSPSTHAAPVVAQMMGCIE